MLDITTYTTYDDVRQVIGIDDDELTDDELGTLYYASSLQNDLYALVPSTTVGGGLLVTLFDRYNTIAAEPEASRSPDEQKMYDVTNLLCTFLVAKAVLPGLTLKIRKTETDGKSSAQRFSSDNAWSEVKSSITGRISDFVGILNQLGVSSSSDRVLPMFGGVPPSNDIVLASTR